jgi:peptidoglycan-associated lipoprotein
MKINPLLKVLLIAVPLIATTACSHKKGSTSASEAADGGAVGADSGLDSGASGDAATRQQFESLKNDNTVYFGLDSDAIQGQYAQLLQSHADFLKSHNNVKVLIEGHTDERGTPEYNIALGERRAKAVAKYMQNLGVDVSQLSIVSYGEEKPANPGHDESAWSQNRRAVLVY